MVQEGKAGTAGRAGAEAGGKEARDGALLPAPVRRPALRLAGGCALVAVALGIHYAGGTAAGRVDRWVVDLLPWAVHPQERIASAAESVVNPVTVALAAVVLAVVLGLRHRWRLAALAIAGPGLTGVVTETGKAVVRRSLEGWWAYPSGHTSGATALLLVGALAVLGRDPARAARRAVPALVAVTAGAAAVGLMMVTLHAHYPTDIVGGYCTAVAVTLGTAAAIDRLRAAPGR